MTLLLDGRAMCRTASVHGSEWTLLMANPSLFDPIMCGITSKSHGLEMSKVRSEHSTLVGNTLAAV